jgi:hypothetical protein
MTILEALVFTYLTLSMLGLMFQASKDYEAKWQETHNALPVFVQMADISKHGFKGTFPP